MKYTKHFITAAVLIAALLIFKNLFSNASEKNTEAAMNDFKLFATTFENGGAIPAKFTCQGDDVSPELTWSGIPEGTKSIALIMDDPDAPDPSAPRIVWVHWILYNIPPNITGLSESVSKEYLPEGTLEGLNSWGRTGYGGPCPPIGTHRYFFKLYALSEKLPNLGNPEKAEILKAMKGKIIGKAELIGTYKKS